MKYLIDTGNVNEVMKWKDFVCGVTTNPKLLPEKEINNFVTEIGSEKLTFIQTNEIFRRLRLNIVIKIPLTIEGFSQLRLLKKEKYKTCGTMSYDIVQLHQAFDIGCDYCIVLCAKNENQNFLEEAVKLKNLYNYKTKLIAASFRTKNDVKKALLSGVDYATIPSKILETIFFNAQADKDYKEIYA